MTAQPDTANLALFCDFENIALGVRDARYEKFDIKRVLDRLLLKGSIVVKKAYCDWDRYKEFKPAMHSAGFELIEIPHVKQSGKNSADIRMVVDALDLCYSKTHIQAFVIVSGDSDFSPLVAKLRENNKDVIGLGVKNSTSDLLIASCDEFIYYDDLVREQKSRSRPSRKKAAPAEKPPVGGDAAPSTPPAPAKAAGGNGKESRESREARDEEKQQEAFDLVLATLDELLAERSGDEKVWGSMVKQALKRRRPGFNERYYGFKSFNELLEDAAARKLLTLESDEKSGGYLIRSTPDAG
jgi:uncharacterized protein (TIGR00288 family)